MKKAKPKTQAVTRQPKTPYRPPATRPSYRYPPSPDIDPQTRHALVTLAEKVTEFENLEDRIKELSTAVIDVENQIANVPETWWERLQVSISTLQKEFNDRVPALERHYKNVELMLNRMDRLEERMDVLKPKLES